MQSPVFTLSGQRSSLVKSTETLPHLDPGAAITTILLDPGPSNGPEVTG